MSQLVQKTASALALFILWLTDENKRASLNNSLSRFGSSHTLSSRWKVKGNYKDIFEILFEESKLSSWWPSVYLNVNTIDSGDRNGIGKIVSLNTKGWLPYVLHWKYRITESLRPNGFCFETWGDLNGKGQWILKQNGQFVEVICQWRVRTDKPLLKLISVVLWPIIQANHQWGMKKGLESLELELRRRQAKSAAELKRIPPPPGPTTTNPLPLLFGIFAIVLLSTLRTVLVENSTKIQD